MKERNLKKLNRLLYLLNMLDGEGINVRREARELEVTERTIQRDLIDIEAGGFPLFKAAPGVYKFIEGFSLKKMNLTEQEASLLLVMQDIIAPLGVNFQLYRSKASSCTPPYQIGLTICITYLQGKL